MTAPSSRVGSTAPKRSATKSLLNSKPEAERQLAAFFDELANVRILDPACGSGNFLYVALRRLLDLWKEARDFAIHHNIQIAITYAVQKMPSPSQLYGASDFGPVLHMKSNQAFALDSPQAFSAI